MIVALPPDVKAIPLHDLSPTTAEALRQCGLRVSFRLDQRYEGMSRASLPAAVGIAAHRLAAMVSMGRFDEVPSGHLLDELGRVWEALLSELNSQIQARSPLGEVPSPVRWPGYQLVRTRLVQQFAKIVEASREQGKRTAHEVESERKLHVRDEGLVGTPDRVELGRDGIEIVDLKTGWTVGDTLDPIHRRQILFYAYLWYRVHGEWPVRGSVQRLDGHRVTMKITPEEAIEEVAAAKTLAEAFDRSVSRQNPVALATPSPDTCRFCDFKGACWAFFAADRGDKRVRSINLLGEVSGVSHRGNVQSVELVSVRGDIKSSSGSRMRILGLPEGSEDLTAGLTISVTDAHPLRSADARVDWETRVWGWADRQDRPGEMG